MLSLPQARERVIRSPDPRGSRDGDIVSVASAALAGAVTAVAAGVWSSGAAARATHGGSDPSQPSYCGAYHRQPW